MFKRKTFKYLRIAALVFASVSFLLFQFGIWGYALEMDVWNSVSYDSNRKIDSSYTITSEDIHTHLTVESTKDIDGITVTEVPHHGTLYINGSKVTSGQYISADELLNDLEYKTKADFQGADKFKYETTKEHNPGNTSSYNFDVIKDKQEEHKQRLEDIKHEVYDRHDQIHTDMDSHKDRMQDIQDNLHQPEFNYDFDDHWPDGYGYQQGPRPEDKVTDYYTGGDSSNSTNNYGGGDDNQVVVTTGGGEQVTGGGEIVTGGGEEFIMPVGAGGDLLVRTGGVDSKNNTNLIIGSVVTGLVALLLFTFSRRKIKVL